LGWANGLIGGNLFFWGIHGLFGGNLVFREGLWSLRRAYGFTGGTFDFFGAWNFSRGL
jgi:hypothetical protein